MSVVDTIYLWSPCQAWALIVSLCHSPGQCFSWKERSHRPSLSSASMWLLLAAKHYYRTQKGTLQWGARLQPCGGLWPSTHHESLHFSPWQQAVLSEHLAGSDISYIQEDILRNWVKEGVEDSNQRKFQGSLVTFSSVDLLELCPSLSLTWNFSFQRLCWLSTLFSPNTRVAHSCQ